MSQTKAQLFDVSVEGPTALKNGAFDVTLGAGGNVTISDGNLVVASGHGIDFSATADSSGTMTSELFDDYEEGTWTPGWNASHGSTPDDTNLTTSGTYVKIGRLVYLYFEIDFNDATAVAVDDRASFNGLPFDPTGVGTITGGGTAWQYSNFANGINAHWNNGLGTSTLYIYCTHEDGSVTYNSAIRGFITYQIP